MKKLQLVIATALLLGLSSAAFTGTPKDAKKEAKTNTKAKTIVNAKTDAVNKSKTEQTFTYYVLSKETINNVLYYFVTTQFQSCPGGTDPCEIETNQQADQQSKVPASSITHISATQTL